MSEEQAENSSPASGSVANHSSNNTITTVNSGKPQVMNGLLWFFGVVLLIAAALVPSRLPDLIASGRDTWVQLSTIAVLAVVGIGLMLITNQGGSFFKLLADVRVELGRVTWPSKDETWEYTWKVLVLMIIAGILVWALDALLTPLIAMIIG